MTGPEPHPSLRGPLRAAPDVLAITALFGMSGVLALSFSSLLPNLADGPRMALALVLGASLYGASLLWYFLRRIKRASNLK